MIFCKTTGKKIPPDLNSAFHGANKVYTTTEIPKDKVRMARVPPTKATALLTALTDPHPTGTNSFLNYSCRFKKKV